MGEERVNELEKEVEELRQRVGEQEDHLNQSRKRLEEHDMKPLNRKNPMKWND